MSNVLSKNASYDIDELRGGDIGGENTKRADHLTEGQGSALSLELDISEDDDLQQPTKNMFNDYYTNLSTIIVPNDFAIKRTYEEPFKTYYFVLTPMDRAYDQGRYRFSNDIKNIEKLMRNKYKYDRIFITREIMDCAKIHYNICMTTAFDLSEVKSGTFVRGKYSIHTPRELKGMKDIEVVCNYMIKESKKRPMYKQLDRFIFRKVA